MKVAVVGGGWAGIAAAVDLTAEGHAVTLFEAGRRLGGRARGVDIDGRRLDNGQHLLLGAYRETLDLMRRIGADPEHLLTRLPLAVIDDAGFRLALPRLPAPLNLAWGLLAARGVPLREKLSTALWMDRLKAQGYRIPGDPTVAAWLDAGGQRGILRRHLWEPLCLAALNTPPELASAQVFANVLRDSLGSPRRADTDLLLVRGDLGTVLPDPAAAWLRQRGASLRLGHRVAALDATDDAIRVDGEAFDHAILATAPQHAQRLWPTACEPLHHEPIATVYLGYPGHIRLDFPLRHLRQGDSVWVIDRGDGLLAGIHSGHGDWEALDDAQLAAALQRRLALGAEPVWQKVIREKRATYSCRPGRPLPDVAPHPRLRLAGDYTWTEYPGTLEGAVRSGRQAARSLGSVQQAAAL